jgi:hypothetical protein
VINKIAYVGWINLDINRSVAPSKHGASLATNRSDILALYRRQLQ